jgi:hypothetical protein
MKKVTPRHQWRRIALHLKICNVNRFRKTFCYHEIKILPLCYVQDWQFFCRRMGVGHGFTARGKAGDRRET